MERKQLLSIFLPLNLPAVQVWAFVFFVSFCSRMGPAEPFLSGPGQGGE
jgi:hypothetical protein